MNSAYLFLKRYLEDLPLNENAVNDVLSCFKIKTYRRNHYYALTGDVQDRLGFVVEGLFVMMVEKPGETAFVKNFLQPGDFLLAAFDPAMQNVVNIRALRESLVLETRHSDIRLLYDRYPDFRKLSERGMQKRYQDICDRLEQMALQDAGGRYEIFKRTFGDLEDEIPQHMVAAYVGVTPTQLSRIRRKTQIA
ncbi:MAG: Crp/Fnr family transcriptional regulator [Leptolinea sp.]|nr:Crp/Fnr family transcriptional regulator [Leptolinea sp.]